MLSKNVLIPHLKNCTVALLLINLVILAACWLIFYLDIFVGIGVSFLSIFIFFFFRKHYTFLRHTYWLAWCFALLGCWILNEPLLERAEKGKIFANLDTKNIKIKDLYRYPTHHFFRFQEASLKKQLEAVYQHTFKYKNRSHSAEYHIIPLVPKSWNTNDSIKALIGFVVEDGLLDKSEKEFWAHFYHEDAIAWRYENPYQLERFNGAIVKLKNLYQLNIASYCPVFQLIVPEKELAMLENTCKKLLLLINIFWLFFYFVLAIIQYQVNKKNT